MKTFDFNRFVKLLKWTFYYNLPFLTKIASFFFVIFLVDFFLEVIPFLPFQSDSLQNELSNKADFVIGCFFTFMIFMQSSILNNVRNKQQTIDFLTLPASNFEKFISRIMFVTLYYVGAFVVGLIAADVLQWLFSLLFFPFDQTGFVITHIQFFSNTTIGNSFIESTDLLSWLLGFMLFLGVIYIHSVYILGGTFFRKQAWVLTSITMFFLTIFIASVLDKSDFNINLADMSSSGLEIIVSIFDVIIVGLIAFNYWLAYRIFTHIQVINNKWFNLVW
ncbi:hypothetical protein SAMN04487899_11417 [Segatella bryantii]|nr:hypothetical protein SAMN04487899_11417 [Segatella bryantii]